MHQKPSIPRQDQSVETFTYKSQTHQKPSTPRQDESRDRLNTWMLLTSPSLKKAETSIILGDDITLRLSQHPRHPVMRHTRGPRPVGQDQSRDQELWDLRPGRRLHQPEDTGRGDHRGPQDEDKEE